MLKIKNVILLILIILVVSGCDDINDVEVEENADYEFVGRMITYCDKKYNVEYIFFTNGNRAGISVRLDEKGNVIHCGEKVE